jgi:hypothetical protein
MRIGVLEHAPPSNWVQGHYTYSKIYSAAILIKRQSRIVSEYKFHIILAKVYNLFCIITSEKIGKDLYRQGHYIKFTEKSGKTIEVITANGVASEECSMGDVDIYFIEQHIEPYPQLPSISR